MGDAECMDCCQCFSTDDGWQDIIGIVIVGRVPFSSNWPIIIRDTLLHAGYMICGHLSKCTCPSSMLQTPKRWSSIVDDQQFNGLPICNAALKSHHVMQDCQYCKKK